VPREKCREGKNKLPPPPPKKKKKYIYIEEENMEY
jgi:hypothetical protein